MTTEIRGRTKLGDLLKTYYLFIYVCVCACIPCMYLHVCGIYMYTTEDNMQQRLFPSTLLSRRQNSDPQAVKHLFPLSDFTGHDLDTLSFKICSNVTVTLCNQNSIDIRINIKINDADTREINSQLDSLCFLSLFLVFV